LIERFPDGKYQEWADEKLLWVNAREAQRRLERDIRLGRKDQWSQAQIQLVDAKSYEQFGDTVTALEKYRAIRHLFGDQEDARPVIFLADEAIERIRSEGGVDTLPALLNKKMAQADQAYQKAQLPAAKMTWESIVELYSGNTQVAPIVQQAKDRLAKLQSSR
jgi:outer membrane protein assembly factor BamD (BamD/ComL family)